MDWNEEELEEIRDEEELEKMAIEWEAVMTQPKEKRLEFYYRYGGRMHPDDLDLTKEDLREYRERKEAEVSMKPTKKRDAVMKQLVKPMLKSKGFFNSGQSWWKELEDCWLFLYMKNSRWNSAALGVSFCFEISVSGKDKIRDELSKQWIYNQFNHLCQNDFLPYNGYLMPLVNSYEYTIDGYKNGLPLDEPLEKIIDQIRGDFENFIFPELDCIRTKADWDLLYREKKAARETEDIRLLRYYSSASMLACVKGNIHCLISSQKDFRLTCEQIRSHFDWLEIIIQNSRNSGSTRALILKALEMQKDEQ